MTLVSRIVFNRIMFNRILCRTSFSSFVICSGIFFTSNVLAEKVVWPDVLTLDYALQHAPTDYPQLQLAQADIEMANADKLSVDAGTGLESRISARLSWIDPPAIAPDQSHADHSLSLFLDKRLYDFGYTSALESAAEAGVVSKQYAYRNALNQHRIAIMAAFFDVLLADIASERDQEQMAVDYVRSDRAADRNKLGMVSDIDLMKLRSIYQQSRARFHASSALQRTARAKLANILNTPENLPSDLATPDLKGNNREIPKDIDEWLASIEKENPLLHALSAKVESAQKRLASARDITNPVLSGQVEVSKYAREMGGYDNWRAGVTLDIPLRTSGKAKAVVAKSRAELIQAKAEMEQVRLKLRQSLVDEWSKLNTLKIERDRVAALSDYRDLYLDRSRALYQQEVTADLGDAMARTSDARFQKMKTEFDLALTWARIEALLGQTVYAGATPDNTNSPSSQEGSP
jgi:outer membrane protein TolC